MRRPKAWRFRLTRTRLTVEGPGQRRTLDLHRPKATQYSRSAAAPAASEESDVAGPVHAALRMAPLPCGRHCARGGGVARVVHDGHVRGDGEVLRPPVDRSPAEVMILPPEA